MATSVGCVGGVVDGKLSRELSLTVRCALAAGQFCLVPAAIEGVSLHADSDMALLQTTAG